MTARQLSLNILILNRVLVSKSFRVVQNTQLVGTNSEVI